MSKIAEIIDNKFYIILKKKRPDLRRIIDGVINSSDRYLSYHQAREVLKELNDEWEIVRIESQYVISSVEVLG